MISELVLATNNSKKLDELRRNFSQAGHNCKIYGLSDFPSYPEPVESADDFQGNALIKARSCLSHIGLAAVADDSGLEVEVLNNMPGVRSARWAGPHSSDEDNLQLLLNQISDVPLEKRRARFVCALALVYPDGREKFWTKTMEGHLIDHKRGTYGFGYDPIFIPDGYQVTSAELSPQQKDQISHRGKAIRAMLADLEKV